jgi:Ca2+-binding RTX toxin-like protein
MKTRPRGRHIDAACAIERLDRRMLLSAAIVHRVLQIRGTGHDDQIELQTDGAQTTVLLGHSRARTFDNGAFDSIVINGKNGDDSIRISDDIVKPATILGGKGDDYLKGGGGDDVIRPGLGNDTLEGGGDRFELGGGVNTADYSDRTEDLTFGGGPLTASGERDVLALGSNLQRLLTGSGDDSIDMSANYSGDTRYIDAGAGNDNVTLRMGGYAGDGTVRGGAGDDRILISGYKGLYYGDAGDDTFEVYRSSHTAREFYGGPGIDTVDYRGASGGGSFYSITVTFDDLPNDGSPTERYQPTPDNVHTDNERLLVTFNGGDVYGSDNSETIIGSIGHDLLVGGGGDDFLQGARESDIYAQSNTLIGGDGDDTLIGGRGNDSLVGEEGDDSLVGNDGDDTLIGGPGDDVLDGGAGNNVIIDESRRTISAARLLDELSGASGDALREIP